MIGKRFRSLPFIFANDNYTLSLLPLFRLHRCLSPSRVTDYLAPEYDPQILPNNESHNHP